MTLYSCIETQKDKIDITELKHFFHRANLHIENPALFKAINDKALNSDFQAEWTEQEMVDFFMSHSYMDIN